MSAIAQAKTTIDNTADATELKSLTFGIDLFNNVLPESCKNEQLQRSYLADTIYYMIQCRLDKISSCKNLYSLGQLYLSLSIPKEFLN